MDGNNPISFSDLFNFNDRQQILDAIKDVRTLKEEYREFLQSVTGAQLKELAEMQRELGVSIRDLVTQTKSLNVTNEQQQRQIAENLKEIDRLRAANKKLREDKEAVMRVERNLAGSVNDLTKQLREQIAQYNRLGGATDEQKAKQAQQARLIAETRSEIKRLGDATRVTTQAFKAAKGSYDELSARNQVLQRNLRSLEGGLRSTSREAMKMRAEIAANSKEMSRFNSGLSQSFNGSNAIASSLTGFAKGFLGITAVLAGLKAITSGIMEFQTLEAGIRAISESEEEFGQQMSFLKGIAEDYGIELTALSDSYKGLAAASRGTSLEGAGVQRIFKAIAMTSTALHLSNEQTRSSLLAVEQMMSKGTVQAQELRLQLGNSLPGAVKIFADAMGVSTSQLQKMMKNGELLSTDVLPKVAQRLEELYSDKARQNAHTLITDTARLSNAWLEFKNAIGEIGFTKMVTGFLNGLSSMLRGIEEFLNNPNQKTWLGIVTGDNLRVRAKRERQQSEIAEFRTAPKEDRTARVSSLLETSKAEEQRFERMGGARQIAATTAELDRIADSGATMFNRDRTRILERQKKDLLRQKDILEESRKLYYTYATEHIKINNTEEENAKRHTNEMTGTEEDREAKAEKARNKAEAAERKRLADIERILREREKLIKANVEYELALEGKRHATALLGVRKGTPEADQEEIKHQEEILRITTNGINLRMALYGKETAEYKDLAGEKLKAENDSVEAIDKIRDAALEREKKRIEDEKEAAKKAAKERFEIEKQRIEQNTQGTRRTNVIVEGNIRKDVAGGRMDPDVAEDTVSDIRIAAIEDERAAYERLRDSQVQGSEEWLEANKMMTDLEIQAYEEKINKEIRAEEKLKAKRDMLRQSALDLALAAGEAFFEIGRDQNEAHIAQLEKQKDKELELAGNNAAAKKKIEENYAKEVAKLRRKQAIADKISALFSIALNTAIGVTNAASKVATIPLIPFIIAQGVLQAAVVAAKPLPQYAKGKSKYDTYEGPARINEAGKWELIEREGKMYVENKGKETIFETKKGDIIHTHEESKQIIREGISDKKSIDKYLSSLVDGKQAVVKVEDHRTTTAYRSAMSEDSMARAFKSAMTSLPLNEWKIDEYGARKYVKTVSQRIEDMNSRNSMFGNG